ncbi:MAG: DNA helicase RecQ [Pontiellaceae bacterium]|nr:DNA helicase RecQ [Pontiellaceae bacterium]
MSVYDALKRVFGFDDFRPNQRGIVEALLKGQDVFAVMPTGGGKSLCYQLPAHMLDGLCMVVSPLISLMKDQVDAAKANGLAAEFINSSQGAAERRRVQGLLENRQIDLLYVSPERFAMPGFIAMLKSLNVAFVAIDEAHCISEWGHDFRPDYLALSQISVHFPTSAIAAFTATATERVQRDIVGKLRLRTPHMVRASFDRPNLFYQVVLKDNLNRQLLRFLRDHPNDAGIIYRTTRKSVEATAGFLQEQGVRALPYHAGLSDAERMRHQEQFNRDEVNVVVATIAFGMGIDKSNVRFVLHGDLPKNVEGYYQETGRAGRDGEPAHCGLYFSQGDAVKIRYFMDQIEEPREQKIALEQLNHMVRLAQSNVCRRKSILAYFGEPYSLPDCGACDVCSGEVERIDATEDAQKIMSAIYRTGGKFGAVHIADIVAGAATQRIQQFQHNELKTYGAGRDRDKRYWRRIIDELLIQGCIVQSDDQYPVLQLAEKGMEVLKGRQSFRVLRQKETARTVTVDVGDYSVRLFNELRAERLRLAREQGVPPFVIFSDRTLREMARYFPDEEPTLRMISGVGEAKAAKFGEAFLSVISAYREAHPEEAEEMSVLQVPVEGPKKKKPKGATYLETLELARRGLSIEEMAAERNLVPGTIVAHIEKLMEQGERFDVDQFIDPPKRHEIEGLFVRHTTDALSVVVEALQGRVSYEEARLVRAFIAQDAF